MKRFFCPDCGKQVIQDSQLGDGCFFSETKYICEYCSTIWEKRTSDIEAETITKMGTSTKFPKCKECGKTIEKE